jgi:hypothetical protein
VARVLKEVKPDHVSGQHSAEQLVADRQRAKNFRAAYVIWEKRGAGRDEEEEKGGGEEESE